MTFEDALRHLKDGDAVTRRKWCGYVYFRADYFEDYDETIITSHTISRLSDEISDSDYSYPASFASEDIMANDWLVREVC